MIAILEAMIIHRALLEGITKSKDRKLEVGFRALQIPHAKR